ncbi:hypothetical protein LCGC14_3148950 [marine sediment metagenome]|uniref:Uncharacterized protein n=1 Tax=marine sediment metagenome TaxID=412755 RepID=A0A0F8VUN0_9ZZZZ
MSKQEEIREGIEEKTQHLFCQHCKAIQKVMGVVAECWYNPLDREHPAFCASNEDFLIQHFKDMDSQGVVIKVERDTACSLTCVSCGKLLSEIRSKVLEQAGYVAVEPLIQEKEESFLE